jgi:inner membrane protein
MNKYTHGAIAAAFTVCVNQAIPMPLITVLAGTIIGSNLPDIDHPLPFVKHRGITHCLLICLLIAIAFVVIKEYVLLGIFMSYLTHIIADMFNGKGCPLLYPFYKKRIRVADLKYDGIAETIIRYFSILVIITIIVYNNYKNINDIYNYLLNQLEYHI